MTLAEYMESAPEKYSEKMKGKVIYFEDHASDASLRAQLLAEGIHAITTDNYIDPHFMQHTEMQKKDDLEVKYQLIDNAIEEILETENATMKMI